MWLAPTSVAFIIHIAVWGVNNCTCTRTRVSHSHCHPVLIRPLNLWWGLQCRDMRWHTWYWLVHRSSLGYTCVSYSGSILPFLVLWVSAPSKSWSPLTCHWQAICRNIWQWGRSAETGGLVCKQPPDAILAEGATGRRIQSVAGITCLLWYWQIDEHAGHQGSHTSLFCHRVTWCNALLL